MKNVDCNLPWSYYTDGKAFCDYKHEIFKTKLFVFAESKKSCETEEDFKIYLNSTFHQKNDFKVIPKNCMQNDWSISSFYEERDETEAGFQYDIIFSGQDFRVRNF